MTAADLVLAGAPAAYACCRPPGHHVTRNCFGGSCYLNNSAAAAARLRQALGVPVAVVDVDAHHGNGTQAIFYEDSEVLVGSVHVDPGAGWFPHFLGFEGEDGQAPAQAQTATLRCRPAAATRHGSRRSAASRRGRALAGRRRSSWRSESTPRPATPRARST